MTFLRRCVVSCHRWSTASSTAAGRWTIRASGAAPTSRRTSRARRSSTSSATSLRRPGAGGRHPLPSAEQFAAAASRAGIGAETFVVAYGSLGGAERLWWLLRHFGHDDCAVLDLDAWHGPLVGGDEQIEPAVFEAARAGGRHDRARRARGERERLVVVDARLEPRWRGEPNPVDRVPGRIPGARERAVERSRCPSSRRARSSRTAARGSPRASSSTGCTSPGARGGSIRDRGPSGSSIRSCRSNVRPEVIRLAPASVLVLVTALLLGYGSHPWSWLAGPIAALVLWGLDRKAREPHPLAPVHRAPAPVD